MISLWLILACWSEQQDSGQEVPSATTEIEYVWETVSENLSTGALMSIWESDDGSLWTVGGQFDRGVVLKKTADSFEEVALPAETPLLNWIHGASADDFWVGGLSGTILHWNGADWDDYSLDIDEAIWGIHQAGGAVFCVGGESRWGGERARIFSLENEGFVEVGLPSEYDGLGNLFKVGYWDDQFWAIGASGALISIVGQQVSAVPTGIATDLVTIHQNQIVGGRGVGLCTSIEDGALGQTQQLPAGLNGVFQYADQQSIVVGERGYAALYDREKESIQEITPVTLDILHAVWVDQQGDAYAVGGNLFTTDDYFHGVILRLKGVR